MTRRQLVVVTLALALATAGCSFTDTATPTPSAEQTNVTVAVENSGNSSFTAEVSLVPIRLHQVDVEDVNGVSRPVTNLSSVPGVSAFAQRNVTDVRLPSGVETGSSSQFQLLPGDRSETNLSVTGSDATLLVIVRQDARVAAWATVYCGQNNTFDRVAVRASGGDPGRFVGIDLSCTQR